MTKLIDQSTSERIEHQDFDFDQVFDNDPEDYLSPYQEDRSKDQDKSLFAQEMERSPVIEMSEVNGSEGIFNVAVLDVEGVKYLFGRKVHEAAIDGEPDYGSLVMAELDSQRNIVKTTEIWKPEGQSILIEDPRAYQSADGRTIIGVTAVRRSDNYRTYPALIELDSAGQLLSEPFPSLRIIDNFRSGDQATPIGQVVEGKNATTIDDKHIMYRPDNKNLSLQVLEYGHEDIAHVGFIEFPDNIPGATYKIGTTTPPEWLNEDEAFFVFHGLDKIIDGQVVDPNSTDSRIIYRYSIFSSRLLRSVDDNGLASFSVDNISRGPIITPESFPDLGEGRSVELHPDIRQVTYSCGGIPSKDKDGQLVKFELFVNQGDKRTWVATLAASDIIGSWNS